MSGQATADEAHLADNIARFARTLRAAGVTIPLSSTLAAVAAVRLVGLDRRDDVRAALRATLLPRPEDEAVFAEAFRLFFRSRNLDERLVAILSPRAPPRPPPIRPKAGARRVEEALAEARAPTAGPRKRLELEIDARQTSSRDDLLRRKDFAQMSAAELDEARRAVAALRFADSALTTRRYRPTARGYIDLRRTLQRSLRGGGDLLPQFRARRTIHPPIVVLADISGSMSRYTEIVLRFAHALGERRRHVSTFVFGTRLTNVSRALRRRDADEAMALCAHAAQDWSGGTRIGDALCRFNRDWSRRVLGQGATVILVTDGLETGEVSQLSAEAERLAKSCRRLIWLSPLLGYGAFAAKARGVRALLAHVDEFRPAHSIAAIEDLCRALGGMRTGRHDPRHWLREGAA